MEEILSSIKRIIAEEGEEAVQAAPRRGRAASSQPLPTEIAVPAPDLDPDMDLGIEEVLELTDEIPEEPVPASKPASASSAREATAASSSAPPREAASDPASILSVESEIAARQSLSTLSSMLVAPREGEDNTLEGLVRAMLRPMLKDWLDAHLPALVEQMVAKEIARITGR